MTVGSGWPIYFENSEVKKLVLRSEKTIALIPYRNWKSSSIANSSKEYILDLGIMVNELNLMEE